MKKILCIITTFFVCISMFSCKKETKEITTETIKDYVSVTLTFGDVSIEKYEEKSPYNTDNTLTKYYLHCMCTITVKPKADYDFKDVSLEVSIPENGFWSVLNSERGGTGLASRYGKLNGPVTIPLDKDGYGSASVFVYTTSDEFVGVHPLNRGGGWKHTISKVSGSVE